MKISYHKVNFEMDFKFPENLEEINNHINSVWRNLPSLTITSDQNLLDETINITQEFAKNKKLFIVIGTGGYSCAIPLYVAIKNKISTAIQEQNVLPGMVTRKFANKVDIVFISFGETKKYLKKKNYFLSGNPIRSII